MECNKRERKTLTVTQKHEVIDLVKEKTSDQLLVGNYGIGK